MKKILAPIDFSLASKTGFDSALQISTIANVEIYALNIYQIAANNYSPDVSLLLRREVEKKRSSALDKFTGNYPNLGTLDEIKPKVGTNIRCGNIVNEIVAFSEENEIDLIVIGTKAKHNLWEYLFGSISTNLIKKSKIPVLIIPEGFHFEAPKNIAFANDFMVNEVSFSYLDDFADIFGAAIHQVHVNILPSDFSDLKEEKIETSNDEKHKIATVIRDKSVVKGLDFFINTHNIDLLALYLPERTFTGDLLHNSVSKRLALNSKIPMLIFKES